MFPAATYPRRAVAFLLFALTSAVPPAQALEASESGCRKALASGAALLSRAVAKAHARCHQDRLRGVIAESIDCNDPAHFSEASLRAVERAEAKISALAEKKCTGRGVLPASIGMHACAAPCGDAALTSFDGTDGAAACLVCRTQTHTSDVLAELYGSPPASADAVKCQKAIFAAWSLQAFTRTKAEQKCQLLADGGRAEPPAGGCGGLEADRRLLGAAARAEKKVAAACAGIDPADFDGCGGLAGTSEVVSCAAALASEVASDLFASSYEPPPARVPTVGPLDYSHWYWPLNHRPTESWPTIKTEMYFMTGHFAFTLDEATGAMAHFGGLHDNQSAEQAKHRPNEDVTALPGAVFRLEAGPTESGIVATSFLGTNASTIDRAKMIDGGRFMNRVEIPSVGYAADSGIDGHFEIATMPRHVVFTHTTDGASANAATPRIVLGGDFLEGLTQQWLEAGRVLRMTDAQGRGWIFVAGPAPATLALSPEGHVVAERTLGGSPTGGVGVSLLVAAAHALTEDEVDLYMAPDATVEVTYQLLDLAGDPVGAAVDVPWDETLGAFRVPAGSLQNAGAPGSANFDEAVYHHWHGRHRIDVDTGGRGPMAVPLAIHGSDRMSWYITGGAPLLRDADGDPNGMPVQISKNWHGEYWYHLYTMPTFSGRGPESMELTMASSKWGDAYAASHAQLSLVGWGDWGGHWDETALGCFGESVTYDPDMTLRRAPLDDVRPFLVQSADRWNWTGNVGGADFLRYRTAAQPYWERRMSRVRSTYNAVGPLLTNVSYSGLSSDGRIRYNVDTRLGAADDLVRVYLHFDYEFLEDVLYDRLAFFQVAADNYSDNLFARVAWGDADQVHEDRVVDDHGTTGYAADTDRGIALTGKDPWVMLYANQRTGDALPERYANIGFIVRSFTADIGGARLDVPHLNLRRSFNQQMSQYGVELGLPHEEGSPWCGASCLGETRFVPAGSRVQLVVEYVVPPADASRYYGQSDHLLALPSGAFEDTAMMLHLAPGNAMEVTASAGTVRRTHPVEIDTVLGEIAAEISIAGGLGYAPLVFHGLERHDGWRLERRNGEVWETVDQSRHGKDFAQVDFDADAGRWSVTVAVPIRGGGDFRLRRLAPGS